MTEHSHDWTDTGDTCAEGCCDKWRCASCGRTRMVEVPD